MSRNWLDKFLDEKAVKIARTIRASYIDHAVRLFEGKSKKFSSVDDALQDFAQRLGLNASELESIKKEAMAKIAQHTPPSTLEDLKEEGITDPKAIEYMSKAKGKHTKDSPSPFNLTKDKAKPFVDELKRRRNLLQQEAPTAEQQSNELGTSSGGGDGSSFASSQLLQKTAEEFGKILPFGEPSMESLEGLKKELGEIDIDTPYRSSRFGFQFTDMKSGGLPKAGQPIKVTTYQYSFLKDEIIKIVNEDLRKQLEQELPFDKWTSFIEEKVKSKEIPATEGWHLVDKIKSMQSKLIGDEKTRPFFVEEKKKRVSEQIKNILRWFPVSYREKILRMLAEGKYRHLHSEASAKNAERTFATGYRRGSFVLMKSFSPYVSISVRPEGTQRNELLKAVVTNKKPDGSSVQEYSNEEFKNLLNSLNIKYTEAPASQEYQILPLHSKIRIKVENTKNTNYEPLTLDEEFVDIKDNEGLLEKLNDHLFDAIRQDAPLAYEPSQSGAQTPLKLLDLATSKKDLTLSTIPHKDAEGKESDLPNPKAGMHTSFEGSIEQKDKPPEGPKDLPEGINFDDMPLMQQPKKKREAPAPASEFDFQKMLDEIQSPKVKKLKDIGTVVRILKKYAAVGLFMDSKGRPFNSEEQMKKTIFDELFKESTSQIIDKVVQLNLAIIESAKGISLPQSSQNEEGIEEPVKKMTPPMKPIEEKEEDKQPLAAQTIVKLRAILAKTKNPHLKQTIDKLSRR